MNAAKTIFCTLSRNRTLTIKTGQHSYPVPPNTLETISELFENFAESFFPENTEIIFSQGKQPRGTNHTRGITLVKSGDQELRNTRCITINVQAGDNGSRRELRFSVPQGIDPLAFYQEIEKQLNCKPVTSTKEKPSPEDEAKFTLIAGPSPDSNSTDIDQGITESTPPDWSTMSNEELQSELGKTQYAVDETKALANILTDEINSLREAIAKKEKEGAELFLQLNELKQRVQAIEEVLNGRTQTIKTKIEDLLAQLPPELRASLLKTIK